MSTIRRQSIFSSGIIYIGFALGFLNTYLFTRQGGFSQTQYGLIGLFGSIANIMFTVAAFGMQSYIYKFYPYYSDHLPVRNNDQLSVALLTGILGFVGVGLAGILFKSLVIRKFGAHSAELVRYYWWIFPFGLGLTVYSLLEAYAWQLKQSVLTNYLREVQFRIFNTLLILLFIVGVIENFDLFIKVYSFGYLLIALILLCMLVAKRKVYFTFAFSRVTRKFRKKILALCLFVWSGGLLHNIAAVFAPIVIASVLPKGLADAGIFILAQYMTSIMQAPQRSINSATIGPLSKSWKDKDLKKIELIYHRSSINQLIFSAATFALIWLNFADAVQTFHLQKSYLDAQYVFLFLGLNCVIDMGTGVNAQIIGTSTYWRFDFITGIVLLALSLPLSYILTKNIGLVGPAVANLISFTVYNGIRFVFLLKKFNMQPFTTKTVYAIVLAALDFCLCHFLFSARQGIGWMALRSFTFGMLYLVPVVALRLSPDVMPVWATVKKRLGMRSE